MLSSHMSSVRVGSTSSQTSSRVSTALIRNAGCLTQGFRSQQQSRNFRLGLWSSYLDPNFQKEARRRYRVVKHKQIEALQRKLSWDRHFPVHPKYLSLKDFMCSAWRSRDPRPGGRWVDVDELFNDKGGMQKGADRGIEDVEQSAVENLMKKRSDFVRSRLHTVSSWNRTQEPEDQTTQTRASYTSSLYDLEGFRKRFQNNEASNTSSHPEYEIDPITNRKVFKNQSTNAAESGRKPIDIPVNTFKGYRSQFQDMRPPPENGPESSRNHGKEINRRRVPVDSDQLGTSKKVYDPAKGYEQYDRKVDYKSGQFYDPSSINTFHLDPVQKGLKDYDDQISRGHDAAKPWTAAENFEAVDPVQEGLKEYDSKVNYASGEFYTPAACKNIDYSHPDQCGLREYDNKISSGETITSNEDLVSSGKKASKAAGKAPKPLQMVGWAQYDSEVDYKSGQFYEPGRTSIDYSDPIQGGLKDYDGKISREGLPSDPVIEVTDPVSEAFEEYLENKKPEEKMRPLDPVEEAFHGYDPVHQVLKEHEYELSGEMQSDPAREALKEFDSRIDYGPKGAVQIAMTSGRFAGSEKGRGDDFTRGSSNNFASSRVGKTSKETQAEKSAKREQLENDYNNFQGAVSADELAAVDTVKAIKGKATERAVAEPSGRKLTGNFVRDFPEEFETSWIVDQGNSGGLVPKKKAHSWNSLHETESKFSEVPAWQRALGATTHAIPQGMRIQTSLDRTATRQGDIEGRQSDGINMETEKSKKISHRNLVREVRQIYEDAYGTIDSMHRQVDDAHAPPVSDGIQKSSEAQTFISSESGSENEPMVYKILAYDPTMQSISIAETTSIVPDSSGPLTPAEVLLRLSNPAKFFPHFLPLQSQGYEIVSGSGDVLVFRKVRSGAPSGTTIEPTPAASEKLQKYKVTNPIDGMQGSPVAATGNFASPTGFVNHDLPVSEPAFKSNIDVRREEPVFSGKRNWEDESEGPRRKGRGKVKKVLIGGAWVAAASYAVGVVAEFFKTGGSDGKGPQGF